MREPGYDAGVNIVGLLNVLSSAVKTGVRRFVFASSGGVPYGISKWAGEQYLQFFVREHGLQAVALRYSNVYGPRQNPHGDTGFLPLNVGTGLATDVNKLAAVVRQHCQRIWQQRGTLGEIPAPQHGPARGSTFQPGFGGAGRTSFGLAAAS